MSRDACGEHLSSIELVDCNFENIKVVGKTERESVPELYSPGNKQGPKCRTSTSRGDNSMRTICSLNTRTAGKGNEKRNWRREL